MVNHKTDTDAAAFDAIVIGSGIGGLAAAAFLARVAGRRVLVLEKHFEPGGFTHVFRRGSWEWDVGLHYVGELAEGDMAREILDFLTNGKLAWNKMPETFERFVYPGLTVEQPDDPRKFEQALCRLFPDEAGALARYFHDIRKAAAWHIRDFMSKSLPLYISAWIRAINLVGRRRALATTRARLQRGFKSEKLKAVLASQWGDYGLPPGDSAFAVHALVVNHYLRGAHYPVGGASRIARSIEETLRRHGGECRLQNEVAQIIIEQGRAAGVRVIDRRGPLPVEETIRAPIVISDAGALSTFSRLSTDRRLEAARAEVESFPPGCAAVTLYLGLSKSPQSLGIRGENLWLNEDFRHDDIEGQTRDLLAGAPRRAYVSFPSLKSGDSRPHTAEIIALVPGAAFSAWQGSRWKQREAGYYDVKDRISAGLLALAERHVPGLKAIVSYAELSTPLSIEHFTGRDSGAMYGIPAIPRRYRARSLRVKTPIRGLFLGGSDVSSAGIVAALMGGTAAAGAALGPLGSFRLMGEVKRWTMIPVDRRPSASGPLAPARDEVRGVLESRERLAETVQELVFLMERPVDFTPGQYMRLEVGSAEWREYSIVSMRGKRMTLLIDVGPGGTGSRFIDSLSPGHTCLFRGPLGEFRLEQGDHPKVFIATGTGITPFLPMLEELADRRHGEPVRLFFGCRSSRDNFFGPWVDSVRTRLKIVVTPCLSRESGPGCFPGRVTAALECIQGPLEAIDFYVSGNPRMTADVTRLLRRRGARHIFTENY